MRKGTVSLLWVGQQGFGAGRQAGRRVASSRILRGNTPILSPLPSLSPVPPTTTHPSRGALLLALLDSYAVRFAEMLDGRSEALPVTELAGGARIRHVFQDIFTAGLDALDPARWVGVQGLHVIQGRQCFL